MRLARKNSIRDADPHLLTLDVLRIALRKRDSDLSLKLFEAKRSIYLAIESGRRDEASALINTLRAIAGVVPENKQLAIAIDGLAEVVVGMGSGS
jgi:hypothetical protein